MNPETRASDDSTRASPEELARLFRQIRTARGREAAIFRAFRERYGPEVVEVTGLEEQDFALREREESLDAVIGSEDSFAWLREVLGRQMRSEAILLTHLLDRYGEEGSALAKGAARTFGRACGREGRRRHPRGRVEDFLAALEEASLHGLPRQAPSIVELRGEDVVIHRAHCPSERTWNAFGARLAVLCAVERGWVDGFCEGFGSGIRHRPGPCIGFGASECRDEFVKGPGGK